MKSDFIVPQEGIRDTYTATPSKIEKGEGFWNYLDITVTRVADGVQVAKYTRNYTSFYGTFEPFLQDGHPYALISRNYMLTACLDLVSGEVIAEEEYERHTYKDKDGNDKESRTGFCPTYFRVPDWHDVHDTSILPWCSDCEHEEEHPEVDKYDSQLKNYDRCQCQYPGCTCKKASGSRFWEESMREPNGQYGFVTGCYWGDDNGWKLQFLDLSQITNGILKRDERFGYIQVDNIKEVSVYEDRVHIPVSLTFDLNTGALNEWQRKQLTKEETGPE